MERAQRSQITWRGARVQWRSQLPRGPGERSGVTTEKVGVQRSSTAVPEPRSEVTAENSKPKGHEQRSDVTTERSKVTREGQRSSAASKVQRSQAEAQGCRQRSKFKGHKCRSEAHTGEVVASRRVKVQSSTQATTQLLSRALRCLWCPLAPPPRAGPASGAGGGPAPPRRWGGRGMGSPRK